MAVVHMNTLDRRHFLARSALASASVAVAASTESPQALAQTAVAQPVAAGSKGTLPMGKIGKLSVSRLISGGNLISGWAHSRDLHYVPSLMRAYNTPEKVRDTLQLMGGHGVNAII